MSDIDLIKRFNLILNNIVDGWQITVAEIDGYGALIKHVDSNTQEVLRKLMIATFSGLGDKLYHHSENQKIIRADVYAILKIFTDEPAKLLEELVK